MKKHFWQQILVPLVLVFAILICGTSNVLGKYAGTNGRHLLASVEFGDTKTSDAYIVVSNSGSGMTTDGKYIVNPGGDPSLSIWGAGDSIDGESYKEFGWNNAEELIFTVENRTDSPVEIEVVIRMALPLAYGEISDLGVPLEFKMPYTLSEVCSEEGTTASADNNLISDPPNKNYYYFYQIADRFDPLYTLWLGFLGLVPYNYVEFEVIIPTELVLINNHIHVYQFNFGTPSEISGGSSFDGDLEELLSYASYKSIQIKAVSQ